MPFNLGGPEFLIILVVVLIVFGAGKLPNVMGDLGRGIKEFKKAQDETPEVTTTVTTASASAAPTATVPHTVAHVTSASDVPVTVQKA